MKTYDLYTYLISDPNKKCSEVLPVKSISEYLFKSMRDAADAAKSQFEFPNPEYNYIVEWDYDNDAEICYAVYERSFGRKGKHRYNIHIIGMNIA